MYEATIQSEEKTLFEGHQRFMNAYTQAVEAVRNYNEAYGEGQKDLIAKMLKEGRTVEEIVNFCNLPLDVVKKVEDSLMVSD